MSFSFPIAGPAGISLAVICVAILMAAAIHLGRRLTARPSGKGLAAPGRDGSAHPGRGSERILVSVSNPASVRNLMELAFLFRERRSKEPIFPVAALTESSEDSAELPKAENLLARAVAQGASAGVSVIPSTRLSARVSEALLQAATGNRASTIILGWHEAPKLSRAFSGSVIEQVILGGTELVVVARVTKPIKAVSRVALILPPLVERQGGFPRALALLSFFLSRTGARLVIFAQKPHGQEAREALDGIRARGRIKVAELESWKALTASLQVMSLANAPVFLFSARPGQPAWHPAVEKLPRQLADELPDAQLLLCYLPEGPAVEPGMDAVEQDTAHGADLFEQALANGRVRRGMAEAAIHDGIRELLRPAFGSDRKTLGRLAALFTDIAQKEPIELEPGIILLHAHVEEVDQPMIFFGARPEGFRLLALEEPARVIVLLCAPRGQSPEAHLKTLGQIARLFKEGHLAQRMDFPPPMPPHADAV